MSKSSHCVLTAALLLTLGPGLLAEVANPVDPATRPPLGQTRLVALPLGAVKPAGWLKDQLTVQADGLTGHLDEFWPDLLHSRWKGSPNGEGWER